MRRGVAGGRDRRRGRRRRSQLVVALEVSERTGAALAVTLLRLAEALRLQEDGGRRSGTRRSPGPRASAAVLSLLPLAGLGLGGLLGGDPLHVLLRPLPGAAAWSVGRGCWLAAGRAWTVLLVRRAARRHDGDAMAVTELLAGVWAALAVLIAAGAPAAASRPARPIGIGGPAGSRIRAAGAAGPRPAGAARPGRRGAGGGAPVTGPSPPSGRRCARAGDPRATELLELAARLATGGPRPAVPAGGLTRLPRAWPRRSIWRSAPARARWA